MLLVGLSISDLAARVRRAKRKKKTRQAQGQIEAEKIAAVSLLSSISHDLRTPFSRPLPVSTSSLLENGEAHGTRHPAGNLLEKYLRRSLSGWAA